MWKDTKKTKQNKTKTKKQSKKYSCNKNIIKCGNTSEKQNSGGKMFLNVRRCQENRKV